MEEALKKQIESYKQQLEVQLESIEIVKEQRVQAMNEAQTLRLEKQQTNELHVLKERVLVVQIEDL